MRVKLAHGVVVAATLFGLTGCHTGPGGSGRTWYGAKTKPATPAYSNAPAGPQLPSAAFNTPGAGASPAAAVASSVPPGAAAGLPASYGAASNAGGPSGTYGATNSAYSAAGGAAAQSGPYNSVYNQASTPVATTPASYPSTNYPPTGTPADPYAAGSAAGATNYAGAPAGIHTADASSAAGYGAGGNMPAAAPPASSQGYQYPDPGRAVDQPGASPYSAGAAAAGGTSAYGAADPASAGAAGAYPNTGAYPTTGAAGAYPPAGAAGAYPPQGAAAAPAAAYPGTGYTGNTSGDVYPQSNYSNSDSTWKPGDTGYTPPGVPPYQGATPAAAPVSTERRDPNWRPGSTSDFNPARGNRNSSGVMSAGYDAPIGAGSAPTTANPYAGGGATAPYGAGSAATPAASTPAYGTGSVMNPNMGMAR